ncbi:LuxR C-terminal-related transcriptional regulator [Nocardioides sp. NPDC004968]|uniref:LuxR C-terminal-related transcriptional regulator n=1 Tax=Nocardioides sp. NPDC004968 TaxID=3155894 RepID=UPI0033AB4703
MTATERLRTDPRHSRFQESALVGLEIRGGRSAVFLQDELAFECRLATLSESHLEILILTAQGHQNKQIAWLRGSSEWTIKAQQQEILRRLGLRTRTQAAVQFAVYCERSREKA